jgi:hypothetical protein
MAFGEVQTVVRARAQQLRYGWSCKSKEVQSIPELSDALATGFPRSGHLYDTPLTTRFPYWSTEPSRHS